MKKLFRMCFLCLLLTIIPSLVFAGYSSCGPNCYRANSVSSTDVQSAFDAADAASGGTVQIPAGSATYTTGITKTITKNLVVVGNGQSATIITDRTDNATKGSAFNFTVNGNVRFELSNMKFISKAGPNTYATLNIQGTSVSVIVHDMIFDMTGITGGRMVMWGSTNDVAHGGGVFYKCTWNNPTKTSQGISLLGKSAPHWMDNPSWGSATAKYIEDCTFNFINLADGTVDAYSGAKGVFRYNKVINTAIGWHGNDSVPLQSAHSFEIYNNSFTSTVSQPFSVNIRGGSVLIFNNAFDSNYPSSFTLSHYRGCASWWQTNFKWTSGWCAKGYPGDGDSDSGYPCQQQPGTSGADGLSNWPVIEWNNSHGGGTNNMGFSHNKNFLAPICTSTYTQKDYVKEEREFISHVSCSDGIDNDGDGKADTNDSRCTTYWDNNLKMAKNYMPLAYPHPLAKPASPRNVQVGK